MKQFTQGVSFVIELIIKNPCDLPSKVYENLRTHVNVLISSEKDKMIEHQSLMKRIFEV